MHSGDERLRHRLEQYRIEFGTDLLAQGLVPLDAPRHFGVRRHCLFHFAAMSIVELAVRVGHEGFFRDRHDVPPSRPPSSASSASRPRARRLVTVPIGTSSTSAASLYA